MLGPIEMIDGEFQVTKIFSAKGGCTKNIHMKNAVKPIAIVTGASKGIGLAIAAAFVAEGYCVIICSRNMLHLEEAKNSIINKYPLADLQLFVANFENPIEVQAFGNFCLQQGSPAILVNNAGIYLPGNIQDEAEGNLELMMQLNFFSTYHLTRQLLPSMMANKQGHIFNISSVAGLSAYPGGGSYSISKFALTGFNKNLRFELKGSGIKVTGIFPGAVMTDSWKGFDNSNNRIMEAGDIAAMVIAASKLSAQATVEDIVVRPQLGDL